MKRFLLIAFIFCLLVVPVGAVTLFFSTQDASHTSLNGYFGGTAGKLDAIDGDILSAGDRAMVCYAYGTGNQMVATWHILREGVDVSESADDIEWIAPDDNAGTYPTNKVWYHVPAYAYGTATPPSLPDDMDYVDRTEE